ncbi:MAG: glycosyltransferase 87 family protein [Oscillospiraceae bacterium]
MRATALQKIKKLPLRWHWLAFGVFCLLAYALFAHPDVVETSNHSYLLLDSTFKGNFLNFYNDVMAHPFGKNLYYTNNAHYNIVIYIIFALAELPVFLFNLIFKTALNEPLLYFIGKLVSAASFIACIPVFYRIARELDIKQPDAHWAALFFALSPPAFFASMVMGQYDSICLFFILMGLLQWLRGKTLACSLWFGLGASSKFFALFLLVPLVLLVEKRPLHIIKHGLVSLWLVLPASLLFWGRTGDMGIFNDIMISRLFSAKIPAASDVSIFPLLYVLLCIAAYLWRPKKEDTGRTGIWLCLAAFSFLFLFVSWHPQWVILLMPFLVLTTFMEKNRTPWFWVDLVLAAGYFLFCAIGYPRQLEANLLDYGLLNALTGLHTSAVPDYNAISFYLYLIPVVAALPMVLFGGAVLAHLLFKVPLRGGTPAARLAGAAASPAKELPVFVWLVFLGGMAVWFVPTLFTWLKCFAIL